MLTLPAIAILGTGSMGGAILGGLLAPGVTVSGGIRVTTRSAAKAAALAAANVRPLALEHSPDANRQAIEGAEVVILGVKPYLIAELVTEIAPFLHPNTVLISVAAGIRTATIESLVSNPVLRAMPNTPATVGRAVTGLAAGSRATADHLALGRAVFETVGSVLEVAEDQIDALSAISGSGPAYVFYFIEQLTDTAVSLGFTAEQAALMVNETFRGATELLAVSGVEPAELRRRVTSPGGTTERAIATFAEADLGGIFRKAVAAAIARAGEIAREG